MRGFRMSGPQVAVLPIDEGSFYPDLGEAIAAACGDSFDYQVCERRALEIPDASDVHEFVGEWVNDNSSLLESDIAFDLAARVAPEIDSLIAALGERNGFAWYPTGEVLTYVATPGVGAGLRRLMGRESETP